MLSFPAYAISSWIKVRLSEGLMQKRKAAKAKKQEISAKKLPAMISFPQGMGRLPEALAADKNLLVFHRN